MKAVRLRNAKKMYNYKFGKLYLNFLLQQIIVRSHYIMDLR